MARVNTNSETWSLGCKRLVGRVVLFWTRGWVRGDDEIRSLRGRFKVGQGFRSRAPLSPRFRSARRSGARARPTEPESGRPDHADESFGYVTRRKLSHPPCSVSPLPTTAVSLFSDPTRQYSFALYRQPSPGSEMHCSSLAAFGLGLSSLVSLASASASPAQLVLRLVDQAIVSPTSRHNPHFRDGQKCWMTPPGIHSLDDVMHLRTSLALDPTTGQEEILVELVAADQPEGDALAQFTLLNTADVWDKMKEDKEGYVVKWGASLPNRSVEEVRAMVECAHVRTRDWHSPLPRRPKLCAHQPLSMAGTPTFFQTSFRFEHRRLVDQVVVDVYDSLADVEEAARLLAEGDPFSWFRGGDLLHTDQFVFEPYSSWPENRSAYRADFIASNSDDLPTRRGAAELGAMIDCAQERIDMDATDMAVRV